ncbi:MAG: hypothetical protein JWO06_2527 [Bacteroidota bacterium]|nr:hypothetical protein [Bacteroidota bacterium]
MGWFGEINYALKQAGVGQQASHGLPLVLQGPPVRKDTTDQTIIIDTMTQWRLLGSWIHGWEERIPGNFRWEEDYNMASKSPAPVFRINELLSLFRLDADYLRRIPATKKPGPALERNDPFNHIWSFTVIEDKYLIQRYVHSYPNGNQTSWYHETDYYFKKVTASRPKTK